VKFIDVANTATFDQEAVPNVDPVCGPLKYEAVSELVENVDWVANVVAFGTKFNAPAIAAYDDDKDAEAQLAEVEVPLRA
jgi:hypothetical protein